MAQAQGQQSPEEIQREIDQARAELAETLDAIVGKVDPRRALDRGKSKALESKRQAQQAVEQGKQQALGAAEQVRGKVDAARSSSGGSGGATPGSPLGPGEGQLYYSTGRELRKDRVALAVAALAVVVWLVRRRG